MKKIGFKTGLMALAVFAFAACSSNNEVGNLTFKKFTNEENIYLMGDKNAPHAEFSLNMEYPVKGEPSIHHWVQEQISDFVLGTSYGPLEPQAAVDKYAETYKNDYLSDVESLYKEELAEVGDASKVGVWYNYYQHMESTVDFYAKSLLVIESTFSHFTGGAHGIHLVNYLNLDLTNLNKVRIQDIFNANYEANLVSLIKDQFKKDLKVESLEDVGFWEDSIQPTENMKLSATGITFLYNVYEIAPYAMGAQEVTLTYAQLSDLLNKENPIIKELLNI